MKPERRRLTLQAAAFLILLAGAVIWYRQSEVGGAPAFPSTPGGKVGEVAPGAPSPDNTLLHPGTVATAPPGQEGVAGLTRGSPADKPPVFPGPAADALPATGAVRPANAMPEPTPALPLEPLITQTGKQSLIARDGTPLRFELRSGEPSSAVELQAWTQDQTPSAASQYDWRFKVRVPAGQLAERRDSGTFLAPEDGYQMEYSYSMDGNAPKNEWTNAAARSFFIRFDDNTYGLLNLHLIAGGAHFVTVKAWLNPTPGSRNLQPPPVAPGKRR